MEAFVILLLLLSAAASAEDVEEVKPGDNATLLCEAADVSIGAVEWTRTDLKTDEYVLFYRGGRQDPTYQHPSFRGRVQLVDDDLKNGDASLILKKVNINDAGTYECRVAAGFRRTKRAVIDDPPISSITLKVKENKNVMPTDKSPEKQNSDNNKDRNPQNDSSLDRNHPGLIAGSAVSALVCVGLFVGQKSKKQREKKSEPADEAETENPPV